jgi:hypothetical protein
MLDKATKPSAIAKTGYRLLHKSGSQLVLTSPVEVMAGAKKLDAVARACAAADKDGARQSGE